MKHTRFPWMAALVFALLGIIWLVGAISTAALPPRPTPQADAVPTPTVPAGAYIELHVSPVETSLWVGVQWQDALSGWHDVKGWQGALDDAGGKRWWVAAEDYGKGPFRWAVYRGGDLLTKSEPFHLPTGNDETASVSLSLLP